MIEGLERDDEENICMGKSDYWKSWYERICKKNPRLMERRRKQSQKYYYENREKIAYRVRQRRLEKNPDARRNIRHKPLKQYTPEEKPQVRKRQGYYKPIINQYPKYRKSMRREYSDGEVV